LRICGDSVERDRRTHVGLRLVECPCSVADPVVRLLSLLPGLVLGIRYGHHQEESDYGWGDFCCEHCVSGLVWGDHELDLTQSIRVIQQCGHFSQKNPAACGGILHFSNPCLCCSQGSGIGGHKFIEHWLNGLQVTDKGGARQCSLSEFIATGQCRLDDQFLPINVGGHNRMGCGR
jgi:hypothetical protein